jgi:hypothetical protein
MTTNITDTPNVKLTPIGPNQTEIERDGVTVLFSYSTPVAAFVSGRGVLVTEEFYSATTSRHINAAANRWGGTVTKVPQAEISALA